jgi:hypothetical protein
MIIRRAFIFYLNNYHGSDVHYRRGDSVCGSRPGAHHSIHHCRFCGQRGADDVVSHWSSSSARWNFHYSNCKREFFIIRISDFDRFDHYCLDGWFVEKRSRRIIEKIGKAERQFTLSFFIEG